MLPLSGVQAAWADEAMASAAMKLAPPSSAHLDARFSDFIFYPYYAREMGYTEEAKIFKHLNTQLCRQADVLAVDWAITGTGVANGPC